MNKFKYFIDDILFVSKLTQVSNKKLRIFLSVLIANVTVLMDILIILIFSTFFNSELSVSNKLIIYFISNQATLPLLVIMRFLFVLLDKLNLKYLQLQVSKNLKSFFLDETFKKSNYTIGDTTYFINQLTDHVSYFYGAFGLVMSSSIQMIVYALFLVSTNYDAVLVFLLTSLVLFFPTKYLLKKGRKSMDDTFKFGQKINQNTQRVIENIYLIKILNTYKKEFEKFSKNNSLFAKSQFKNYYFNNLNSLIPNFLVTFTLSMLIIFFNFIKYLSLEFIGVTLRLVQTLGVLNNGLNMLINSHVHMDNLKQIVENSKSIKDSQEIHEVIDKENIVELENVHFRFFSENENIFDSLNLNIKKNTHTVITGPNGSGKSTLLGIIAGILIPGQGQIRHSFKKIGYVGVKPLIIDGTLKENILYGNKEKVSDEVIIKYINELMLFNENEFDLSMKVSSLSLSSGQIQKIGFIRALISKIDFLILDESTSNLDDNSKLLLFNMIKERELSIVNSTHNPQDFDYDLEIKIKVDPANKKRSLIT